MAKKKQDNHSKVFDAALQRMKNRDPAEAEEGFGDLERIASNYVEELLEAFQTESDFGVRCWLLELLGEARSESLIPFFTSYLQSTEDIFRSRALYGLKKLDMKESRRILWEAEQRGLLTQE